MPANLPDLLAADISGLKIGSKLLVTSLFNDAYTFMHPDNTVVVQVRTSRNATARRRAKKKLLKKHRTAASARISF